MSFGFVNKVVRGLLPAAGVAAILSGSMASVAVAAAPRSNDLPARPGIIRGNTPYVCTISGFGQKASCWSKQSARLGFGTMQ